MANRERSPSPPAANVAERIVVIRGHKVILDSDLAALYGVPTKRLNEQVRRNPERFPLDFMFLLSDEEWASLRSRIATLKIGRGQHRKFLPYVFTEHGALMAAGVLNSPRAIEVSIFIVRAFVELRETLSAHKEVSMRLNELEASIESRLSKHDQAIANILAAIRNLMTPPEVNRRPIGFVSPDKK
jgi:phage regulator Rha-like protein